LRYVIDYDAADTLIYFAFSRAAFRLILRLFCAAHTLFTLRLPLILSYFRCHYATLHYFHALMRHATCHDIDISSLLSPRCFDVAIIIILMPSFIFFAIAIRRYMLMLAMLSCHYYFI